MVKCTWLSLAILIALSIVMIGDANPISTKLDDAIDPVELLNDPNTLDELNRNKRKSTVSLTVAINPKGGNKNKKVVRINTSSPEEDKNSSSDCTIHDQVIKSKYDELIATLNNILYRVRGGAHETPGDKDCECNDKENLANSLDLKKNQPQKQTPKYNLPASGKSDEDSNSCEDEADPKLQRNDPLKRPNKHQLPKTHDESDDKSDDDKDDRYGDLKRNHPQKQTPKHDLPVSGKSDEDSNSSEDETDPKLQRNDPLKRPNKHQLPKTHDESDDNSDDDKDDHYGDLKRNHPQKPTPKHKLPASGKSDEDSNSSDDETNPKLQRNDPLKRLDKHQLPKANDKSDDISDDQYDERYGDLKRNHPQKQTPKHDLPVRGESQEDPDKILSHHKYPNHPRNMPNQGLNEDYESGYDESIDVKKEKITKNPHEISLDEEDSTESDQDFHKAEYAEDMSGLLVNTNLFKKILENHKPGITTKIPDYYIKNLLNKVLDHDHHVSSPEDVKIDISDDDIERALKDLLRNGISDNQKQKYLKVDTSEVLQQILNNVSDLSNSDDGDVNTSDLIRQILKSELKHTHEPKPAQDIVLEWDEPSENSQDEEDIAGVFEKITPKKSIPKAADINVADSDPSTDEDLDNNEHFNIYKKPNHNKPVKFQLRMGNSSGERAGNKPAQYHTNSHHHQNDKSDIEELLKKKEDEDEKWNQAMGYIQKQLKKLIGIECNCSNDDPEMSHMHPETNEQLKFKLQTPIYKLPVERHQHHGLERSDQDVVDKYDDQQYFDHLRGMETYSNSPYSTLISNEAILENIDDQYFTSILDRYKRHGTQSETNASIRLDFLTSDNNTNHQRTTRQINSAVDDDEYEKTEQLRSELFDQPEDDEDDDNDEISTKYENSFQHNIAGDNPGDIYLVEHDGIVLSSANNYNMNMQEFLDQNPEPPPSTSTVPSPTSEDPLPDQSQPGSPTAPVGESTANEPSPTPSDQPAGEIPSSHDPETVQPESPTEPSMTSPTPHTVPMPPIDYYNPQYIRSSLPLTYISPYIKFKHLNIPNRTPPKNDSNKNTNKERPKNRKPCRKRKEDTSSSIDIDILIG